MKKISINFLFPLLSLIILIFGLSQQLFNLFPLGKILNPFSGVVQNEDDRKLNSPKLIIDKLGLDDTVDIFFDNRKVPHIYAKNAEDLYFAQGYLTASLRLWQMDFLSHASAGRLSEIFVNGFLGYDREERRMGILEAATASLKMMEKDPATNEALTAYSRGVNAYIRQLTDKELPLEYKLLDYTPEAWSNLKTVLIIEYMANTLSGYEDDLSMTNMMLALGENDFNKFFPEFTSHITPVANIPVPPMDPTLAKIKKPEYLNYAFLSSNSLIPENSYNPKLGSNSWAVSGKLTKSGFPILCSDPHLNLSLPSIWIEMQLSSPGMNVYGASIPGIPAVMLGFNDNIAWGISNGADDVKDWYKLKMTSDYKKYELDGKWLPLNYRIEKINRRNQEPIYDTIYSSIHGPIVFDRSISRQPAHSNFALKWELHNPSNGLLTFIKLNSAKNYMEYKEAIKYYSCPIMNFTFACKDNTIAVVHQGNMAIKSSGQGKFILDGTSSSQLYTGYIPEDSLPQTLNPSCNYVISANQHPTYPGYKYYYNGYYSESRANRIRQVLENGKELDIKKMEALQLDNTNSFAVDALPVLTKELNKSTLTEIQQQSLKALEAWKGMYDLNDENAELFELWWKNIKDFTWDEFRGFSFKYRLPEDYVLLDLIRTDPFNDIFDKQGTNVKENADNIVQEAFNVAYTEYDKMKKTGSIKWGDLNKVNITHLADIKAFSSTDLPSAGHPEAPNAISANWGPSWRMVVELGERPKAYGIYPGGQSGHVGSAYYDNSIKDWNRGEYYSLTFFISRDEARTHATGTWSLK